MLREINNINKLSSFDFEFLLSAYADDTTFFVTDLASVTIILQTFECFSLFSGLKLNVSKCEITGIRVKKNDVTALCGFKNVSLLNSTIRILGVHFSYNNQLCTEKTLWIVLKTYKMLSKYGICVA